MAVELLVLTPEREAYRGPVADVVLPGEDGEFAVLERHERLLAPLGIGEARIRADGDTRYAAVNQGFAEVTGERVVVLVDTFELAEDIDTARAEAARERAEHKLEELRRAEDAEHQMHLYEAALQRAIVRIRVGEKAR